MDPVHPSSDPPSGTGPNPPSGNEPEAMQLPIDLDPPSKLL